jgi:hypothetical protein
MAGAFFEATLRGQAAQIVKLSLRVLVNRGNPQVQGTTLYQRRAFFFGASPFLPT